ncbi:LysR family transcriptional regulator [Nitrobacter winogradskyi]|uniref:DNA-binding transcriptional LysR family regulator n=1 Tax=Nitrobacter winogradskyi TaxID=913 RepID=A0ACC6ANC1_NITWI|nr:LysR family transcriptional regulator [Nitrobacter winogradskyi]MCP2001169.1 DNA-binding transcriptional LysR family regulator [Nitrobacter winogradskyi]
MDLRHLRYIAAAARNGSFSAAVNEFNDRRQIVSRACRKLYW